MAQCNTNVCIQMAQYMTNFDPRTFPTREYLKKRIQKEVSSYRNDRRISRT
jgi:hypothetical protein